MSNPASLAFAAAALFVVVLILVSFVIPALASVTSAFQVLR